MTTTLNYPTPPGPVSAPPPLSPGGRTAIRFLLIAAAGVLVVGLVAALTAAATGISNYRMIKDSVALPNTLTSVTIDTGSVPIAVRITSDREVREPRVDMRMVNSTRAGADPLTVAADGTAARVTIGNEPSRWLQWGRAGEITVVLPPDLARRVSVTTQQEDGTVDVRADVDQFTARTVTGDIRLGGSARRVDITNEHGDVTTRNQIAVADSFRATTTTGDISVEFAGAPKTVDATTELGDITVSLPPPGPYLVTATTAMPDASSIVEVPRTDDRDNAAAVVTTRTELGDIVVDALD